MKKYILDGKKIREVNDLLLWARWFENADRHVAKTKLENGVEVSTVFMGIDHSFGEDNIPILFETMILEGEHDGYQERYATWEEAEIGHKIAVKKATE